MVMQRLKGHALFGLLNPKEMERLSAASSVLQLVEGERLYSADLPATHLFVLLKGRVELRRPGRRGEGLLVDDLLPGSLFGVSSLSEVERYLLNAECVEPCEVLKVEARVLRSILEQNTVVGYAIQKQVTQIFFKRYVDAMTRLQEVMRMEAVV